MPTQFSIRQLLLLLIPISLALALSTQLGGVGIIASVYVIALAAGLWLRWWRIVGSAATGLAIFVITLLAIWTQMGYEKTMNEHEFVQAEYALLSIQSQLDEYRQNHGAWPERLDDPNLFVTTGRWLPDQDFSYRRTDDGYELRWLGRDGDQSWSYDELHAEIFARPLTLREFLFGSSLSPMMIFCALVASVLAALPWLAVSWSPPIEWWGMASSFGFTIIASVVVASVLAGLHVALSQGSGH